MRRSTRLRGFAKQHVFSHRVCNSGVQVQLSWVLWLWDHSHKAIKVLVWVEVISRLSAGEWAVSKCSHMAVGWIKFLLGCWLESTLSCLPLESLHRQLLVWQLASPKQQISERLQSLEKSSPLCKWILGVRSYLSCHIPVIKIESPYSRRYNTYAWKQGMGDSWGAFSNCLQ